MTTRLSSGSTPQKAIVQVPHGSDARHRGWALCGEAERLANYGGSRQILEFWQRVAGTRPDPISVHSGHWRLKLETSVRGVGATSGAEYNVSDVVVFWSGYLPSDTTLQVAVSVQPDTALYLPHPGLRDSGAAGQGVQPLVRIGVRAPYIFEILRVQSP